jgi:hypothetical protein
LFILWPLIGNNINMLCDNVSKTVSRITTECTSIVVMLSTPIFEVLGTNLDWDTSYSDW